eukprot:771326_1
MYDFRCQHGVSECQGNMIMACAVADMYNNDPLGYSPFIVAFEQALQKDGSECANGNIYSIAQSVCNDNPSLQCNWDQLWSCVNSKEGNTIYHEMGVATFPTNLTWVQWIVINDQHDTEIQEFCSVDLLGCTCQHYQGNSSACS